MKNIRNYLRNAMISILVPGYVIYGLVYIGFAPLASKPAVTLLFIAYGACTAFISGAERAFITEAAPVGFKDTILDIHGMLQGIGLLLSSIIAGIMWDRINSNAPLSNLMAFIKFKEPNIEFV